jgi:hypothetical protein
MEGNYALGPRGNKDSFFDKMKKKPDVRLVLDNLDNYTVEQLSTLSGTHFPQWVRDALVRKKEGRSKGDIEARVAEIARKMAEASGEQVPYYEIEDLPVIEVQERSGSSKERRITSEDFTSSEDRRTGVILDSSTHGKHDDPGFEEHMRKVRQKMKEK